MKDKAQIEQLYQEMYETMVNKDEAKLEHVHDDTFVLFYMSGAHQTTKENIRAIMSGVLNYYSSEKESLDISINKKSKSYRKKQRECISIWRRKAYLETGTDV